MRITALVKSHDHVCCRYRIAAFRSSIERSAHKLDVKPWSSGWFLEHLLPSFLDSTDVLIIQRKLFPSWQLKLLRRHVRWLVYDFDDSIFLRSSYNSRGPDCPRRLRQFKQMMHAADVVVAGNDFLCEQASGFAPSAKVHQIPTCLDVHRYRLALHDDRKRNLQLAWIGSSSTLRSLEKIRDLLEDLGKNVPRLELKLLCDRSITLQHMPVHHFPWRERTEASELAGADIGICWMPDDRWSEGKCGLKVLQYMAAGLPVVANPVGVQKHLIRHGETGFLVETPREWSAAIEWLTRDADLRRAMGRAGRRLVEAKYHVTRGEAGWQRVLKSLESLESLEFCDRVPKANTNHA